MNPLAIIGYGCRLPGGVDDGSSLWQLLAEGRDAVREIPPDRWNMRAVYDPRPGIPGKTASKWAGLLEQIDLFEPECFGISPREAAYIDPQQRLLLETTWEALEHAGIPVESIAGSRTGVFVGICTTDYCQLQLVAPDLRNLSAFTAQGNASSIAANRISYCFDLRGPSLSIDTACSSSLVALDRAARSLHEQESDLCIVGGVNVIISVGPLVSFSQASMLSPEGRCKAFDASAHGFVRAEGAGVVLLKRVDDALAAGDRIHAVVLASGVNQDGRTSGMAMPNVAAQEALLREVYAAAGLRPEDIAYVEAHGTGTPIGDPIEAAALGRVFRADGRRRTPLIVGSVKSNIGHLEAGAGVASLLKAIQIVKHRRIPPSLHFRTPNPHIPFAELGIRVPVTLEDWPDDRAAIIGINSFGFGGTNAHAVIGEYREHAAGAYREPAASRGGDDASSATAGSSAALRNNGSEHPAMEHAAVRTAVPMVLTARNAEALQQLARSWLAFIDGAESSGASLADIAAIAATRRSHCAHVLAFAASTFAEARDAIGGFANGDERPDLVRGERPAQPPSIAFVFSGQGPQWYGMGRELYCAVPVFRATMDRCDTIFRACSGWSIVEEIHAAEPESRMDHTAVAQPALFALQVSLAAVWKAWGVAPVAVMGHSVGELAAAYVAGALSLETAVQLIARRGRALEDHALPGRMLAVRSTEADVRPRLDRFEGRVEISAVNGSDMLTLGGDPEAIDALACAFAADDIWCKPLQVSHAFHTARVEPARNAFLEGLTVECTSPATVMISTVTGRRVREESLGADYWWRNIREPVRFADAVRAARELGVGTFVEIGPHPVLSAVIRQVRAAGEPAATVLPSLVRGSAEPQAMLASLLGLFARGARIDWPAVVGPTARGKIELPRHPWTRQRYWQESEASLRLRTGEVHPLLGAVREGEEARWHSVVDPTDLTWIRDHRVGGLMVYPAAAFVETATAAAMRALGSDRCTLDNLHIERGLVFQDTVGVMLETRASIRSGELSIASRVGDSGDAWVQHVTAGFRAAPALAAPDVLDAKGWHALPHTVLPGSAVYDDYRGTGMEYGPTFQGIVEVAQRGATALARIQLPDAAGDDGLLTVHPALLDACFHVLLHLISLEAQKTIAYLPSRIGRVTVHRRPGRCAWSEVQLLSESVSAAQSDVRIYTERGELAIEIAGLQCRGIPRSRERKSAPVADCFYRSRWHYEPLADGASTRPRLTLRSNVMRITRDADRAAAAIWHDHTPERLQTPLHGADRLASAHVVKALAEICGKSAARPFTVDLARLTRAGALAARALPQIEQCLQGLVQAGMATATGARRWRVTFDLAEAEADGLWRRALAANPDVYPWLRLCHLCGSNLAAFWSGRADPLEVLFSRDSVDLLEQVYRDFEWTRYANAFIAQVIAGMLEAMPADRPLRILEVGAGTGGTTAAILPVLPAERTQYWFTDVSAFFLARAQERFHAFEFLQYRRVDLEAPFGPQDITAGSFDVVIAADVLHGMRNVGDVLDRCREALVEGGVLIARELQQSGVFFDLLFGSTDGWWNWRSDPARRHGPLLKGSEWSVLLQRHGFEAAAISPACNDTSIGTAFVARAAATPAAHATAHDTTPLPADASAHERDWLVVTTGTTTAQAVIARLRQRGLRCIEVCTTTQRGRDSGSGATSPPPLPPDSQAFDLSTAADRARLAQLREAELPATYSLLDLRALAADENEAPAHACARVVELVQAIAAGSVAPQRWTVALDASRSRQAAALTGLCRVVANEFADAAMRMITVDSRAQACTVELCAEILADARHEEVAWHGGHRFVARLERAADVMSRPIGARNRSPFALVAGRANDLDSLHLVEHPARPLRAHEVEVDVHFAALNFRDVLKALGQYPKDDPRQLALGDECSGIVRKVGRDVEHIEVGDRVVVCHPGTFRSSLVVPGACVLPIPARLDLQAAVSMPVAFLTADYALRQVGKLAAGETVLIHAAAGGVGLAAMQIARRIGARIFATAGTPAKREFVLQMGAERAMDSRSLAFGDEVLAATSGRGVDVVLNSLAGQAMTRSLACLAPRGRFLELGKRDFYENTHIGLWSLRQNVSYHAIDVSTLLTAEAAAIPGSAHGKPHLQAPGVESLRDIFAAVATGEAAPLPVRIVPVSRAAEAFRQMAQGAHVGKILLDMTQHGGRMKVEAVQARFRPHATYMVTGAFSGIGLATTGWLVDRGARYLALVSRTGARTDAAQAMLEQWRAAGIHARVLQCDVADRTAVAALIDTIDRDMPPLAGVFHLASIIDDGLVLNIDAGRIARSMAPKVDGGWNLHCATRERKLDHFVLFGSAAATVGNVGQASYSAANATLEQLARDRRAAGLPGLAIAWGALGGAGYVAERPELEANLTQGGLWAMSIAELRDALDIALTADDDVLVSARIDWQRIARRASSGTGRRNLVSDLALVAERGPGDATTSIRDTIKAADAADRPGLIAEYVRKAVGRVLGMAAAKISTDRPLTELGLDSLMGVELAGQIEADLGIVFPLNALGRDLNIARLAHTVARALDSETPPAAPASPSAEPEPALESCVVQLAGASDKPPLFCFHPTGGAINVYSDVAKELSGEYRVLGIRSRVLAGAKDEFATLDEMAAAYADLVQREDPAGPHHLFGFSFGGQLALRTARILLDRGKSVAWVGLAETHLSWSADQQSGAFAAFLIEIFEHVRQELGITRVVPAEILRSNVHEFVSALQARGMESVTDEAVCSLFIDGLRAQGYLPEEVPRALVEQYVARMSAHVRLLALDAPCPAVDVPVHVWTASEGAFNTGREAWHTVTEGPVAVRTLPGTHFDVLAPPQSQLVAAELARLVTPACAAGSAPQS